MAIDRAPQSLSSSEVDSSWLNDFLKQSLVTRAIRRSRMQDPRETVKQLIKQGLGALYEQTRNGEHASVFTKYRLGRAAEIGGKYVEAKKKLFAAEFMAEVLGEMSSSASFAATKFRDQFNDMANKELFHILPDDILATIFEFAWPDSESVTVAKTLSLVSRRFRKIVLSLSILWSRISSPEVSLETAALYALRVTTPAICLKINGSAPPKALDADDEPELDRIIGAYELAVSSSSRIRTMTLNLSKYDQSHLVEIRKTCSSASFPFLDELVVDCRDEVGHEVQSLFLNWTMPSLKKLDLKEILPELRPGVSSGIEVCFVEVNKVSDRSWGTEEVVDFLLSLTSMRELRISATLIDEATPAQEASVMALVTDLSLRLYNSAVASEPSILDIIQFPAIKTFKLEVGVEHLGSLEDVLANVIFKVPPTSVTDVTLAVGVENDSADVHMAFSVIDEWCEEFGELHSLTVESDRRTSHGLLGFANSIDAVQVVDPEGKLDMSEVSLIGIPSKWHRRHHPRRKAVVQKKDVGRPCLMERAQYRVKHYDSAHARS